MGTERLRAAVPRQNRHGGPLILRPRLPVVVPRTRAGPDYLPGQRWGFGEGPGRDLSPAAGPHPYGGHRDSS